MNSYLSIAFQDERPSSLAFRRPTGELKVALKHSGEQHRPLHVPQAYMILQTSLANRLAFIPTNTTSQASE